MRALAETSFDGLAVVGLRLQSSPAGGPVMLSDTRVVLMAGQLTIEVASIINDAWPQEVQQRARDLVDAMEAHLVNRPPFAEAATKPVNKRGIV